jgi:hypothetical protein
MTFYIAPLVEGQTEQGCVASLLHRVWGEMLGRPESLRVLEPARVKRDAVIAASGEELAEQVERAALRLHTKVRQDATAGSLLLILLDAERDCPAELAPRLLDVAKKALPVSVHVDCVLAKRMLENWIVAGASALAGVNGLPDPLPLRDRFEDHNGADWLRDQLRSNAKNRTYQKTIDALTFIRRMDLTECRANAASFDKLYRVLEGTLPPSSTESPAPA